jgi:A/G-specific adenine glycosylase
LIGSTAHFSRQLLSWYDTARRDLPWRVPMGSAPQVCPNPYYVLLSELMLQQTQVSTVVDYFHRFVAQFPTIQSLAQAHEQDVLRLWQGLGYYSRARYLHAAAKAIVARHGGIVPSDVKILLELPGVGRYTAGAVASLAWQTRAPILDGNVQRVVCRLYGIEEDPRDRAVNARLWELAEAMLPQERIGDFNSSLMELGAMVCTPQAPACRTCPVSRHCVAHHKGLQDRIPPARKAKPSPQERRWVFCIAHKGKWLIEQRPAKGRWAGLWQFITIPAGAGAAQARDLAALGLKVSHLVPLGTIRHVLTHRRYEFEAVACHLTGRLPAGDQVRAWATPAELSRYPFSRPQLLIADLAFADQLNFAGCFCPKARIRFSGF